MSTDRIQGIPHASLVRLQAWLDRAIPAEVLAQSPLEVHRARLLVTSSVLSTACLLASVSTLGFAGPAEPLAAGVAAAVFCVAVPLLWLTRTVDWAANSTPAGLFAYGLISTYGSGGALPFPALMFPIAALTAGLLCSRRAALGWVAAQTLAMPAAAAFSPATAPEIALLQLYAGLVFAPTVLVAVLLYRGLFERVLAERLAMAREAEAAALRQAALDARLRETERLASLGRMAGGLAHDFNNILTAIGGSAELLGLSPQAGRVEREHAARIGTSVDRAAALVKQLLDFTGRGRRRLERISLRQRIDESARILAAGLSKQSELQIVVHDDAQLEADPVQVDQLVIQLVQNAERAYGGKPGAIRIEIDRADFVTPAVMVPPEALPCGAYAELRVSDGGCGICADDLPRIFDPFFSGFSSGRGLGLAAVLGIVRGHGGGIAVRSALGAGTTMTVYLPCDAGDELTRAPEPELRAFTQPSLRGLRVLVVDDEPAVRAVLVRHLESAETAAVHAADDGARALTALANSGPIDVAFIDVSMPTMNGVQLLEALRASGRTFPVVLMTGHAEVDLARFGDEANVAVLLKPFRLDEVGAAVERARGGGRAQELALL